MTKIIELPKSLQMQREQDIARIQAIPDDKDRIIAYLQYQLREQTDECLKNHCK